MTSTEVLGTRSTMFYTFSATLVFGAFVVYLATAQQVLEESYNLGPMFPWAFGALAFAFALASFANSRLVMRYGMRRLSLAALVLMIAISAVAAAPGIGTNRSDAAVMIPNVPSAPINACLRSGPILFLRKVESPSQSAPSARTTSNPRTCSRIIP